MTAVGLPKSRATNILEKLENIKSTIRNIYGLVELTNDDNLAIIKLMKFDKKNTHGNINFVLLEDIGKSKIDCKVENALIMEAFDYYKA